MMKYLEQYIEEKLRIKVLGKLTTTESTSGEEVGVSLVIDGFEPGIEVWYADRNVLVPYRFAKFLNIISPTSPLFSGWNCAP